MLLSDGSMLSVCGTGARDASAQPFFSDAVWLGVRYATSLLLLSFLFLFGCRSFLPLIGS